MRLRFPLALLATLLLSGFATDIADVYDSDKRIAKIVWRDVCELSRYSCRGLTIPSVRRSPTLDDMKAYGVHWRGSPVVWLNTDLVGSRAWLTMFHEMVHYLQGEHGAVGDNSRFARCLIEREALDLSNEYAIKLGVPHMTRTVAKWKELYGC